MHHGILFLDEFGEFQRNVLEMIRQPLEEGAVTISRAKGTLRFPARFIMISAMNPCPCGYYGTHVRRCKCTPVQIERYMGKISGPLLDRIDIHVEVAPVAFRQLRGRSSGTDSKELRHLVQAARTRQAERFGNGRLMTNATMTHREVEAHCRLNEAGEQMLKQAMMEFALSAGRTTKFARLPEPSPIWTARRRYSRSPLPKPSATAAWTERCDRLTSCDCFGFLT